MTEDQYAQRALSELIAHILSKRSGTIEGLNYQNLAFRIGRRNRHGEGVAIGMGRILGRMGHMLRELENNWSSRIPNIQCLVIDTVGPNQGLPGDGIDESWSDYRSLTRREKEDRVHREHREILAFGSQWNQVLKRLGIWPVSAARKESRSVETAYWVVSPNVRNNEVTVQAWRRASVVGRAAFMGWDPNDMGHGGIGPAFAGKTKRGINPGDVILIARRHRFKPEIVGFGTVHGEFAERIRGVKTPETFGSLRRLSPFIPWTGLPPSNVPLAEVVRHTKALVRLHPDRNDAHRIVCEWLDQQLYKRSLRASAKPSHSDIKVVSSPDNHQLDYRVQTRARIIKAARVEAGLIKDYQGWLAQQGREISAVKYGTLQCDAYEEGRNNLIEAKSSTHREHIRMAVGQLLDYAFQGKMKLGDPHKAILLPNEPCADIVKWLDSLEINIIWREKKAFVDNANGRFT